MLLLSLKHVHGADCGEAVWCCLYRFDADPACSTLVDSEDGGRFRIGPAGGEIGHRIFRPTQLIRIVGPIEGTPRIGVVCEPRLGWSRERPSVVHESHHARFEGFASQLRRTTDFPLSYLGGNPFTLIGRCVIPCYVLNTFGLLGHFEERPRLSHNTSVHCGEAAALSLLESSGGVRALPCLLRDTANALVFF